MERQRCHGHRHSRRSESEVSCCVKYLVFGFNVIFWIIGLTVLLVGIWAQAEKNPFSQLGTRLSRFYMDPAWILIMVGFVTFIIGFSGCVGALRENTCLLACYSALVGILLLVELTFGILGFVFKDWVKQQLESELDEMIVSYRDDPDLQSVIDWIQMDWLNCCGIHGPSDWDMNIYFNSSSEALGSPEAGGVPFSCCIQNGGFINYYCGHGVRKKNYVGVAKFYSTGCLPRVQEWFSKNMVVVGSIAVAVAVLEILGICFAQNLRSDIFAQRARWQYQASSSSRA